MLSVFLPQSTTPAVWLPRALPVLLSAVGAQQKLHDVALHTNAASSALKLPEDQLHIRSATYSSRHMMYSSRLASNPSHHLRGFATTGLVSSEVLKAQGTTSSRLHDSLAQAGIAPHAGMTDKESFMEHPAYLDTNYLERITPSHRPPQDAADRAGLAAVTLLRRVFDWATGYGPNMSVAKWVQRTIFLETVAGVPGMVAGMLRHLQSLRRFKRDAGWIHTLLEEAENERMHLLTFLELRKPGPLFRAMVIMAQGVFFNAYFIGYLLWPKACHSFVGYLEEEAVRTYTHLLKDIDEGKVWKDTPAPPIAIQYWGLKPDANMRDLILAVRADEACHSHVNHTLKSLNPTDPNPFAMGKSQLP